MAITTSYDLLCSQPKEQCFTINDAPQTLPSALLSLSSSLTVTRDCSHDAIGLGSWPVAGGGLVMEELWTWPAHAVGTGPVARAFPLWPCRASAAPEPPGKCPSDHRPGGNPRAPCWLSCPTHFLGKSLIINSISSPLFCLVGFQNPKDLPKATHTSRGDPVPRGGAGLWDVPPTRLPVLHGHPQDDIHWRPASRGWASHQQAVWTLPDHRVTPTLCAEAPQGSLTWEGDVFPGQYSCTDSHVGWLSTQAENDRSSKHDSLGASKFTIIILQHMIEHSRKCPKAAHAQRNRVRSGVERCLPQCPEQQ